MSVAQDELVKCYLLQCAKHTQHAPARGSGGQEI